jgi:EmrB/QacA subfamily drug resistance transporter
MDVTTPEGHPRRRAILAVLCLSLLIVVIDNTILNTALPTLAEALGASTSDLQWITDGYTLTFAALLIVAGALGDRYGRRRALLLGLIVFAAGSSAAAVCTDATYLIAARAFMGLGGAFVMPATLSILTAVFPARERAGAIGAWSAITGVGIVVGPTLGGLLLNHFSWGSVFWINVPLVAIAVLAVLTVIPAQPGHGAGSGRLDLLGATLSAAALLTIVDAVIEGPDRGWTSLTTLGEAVLGIAVAAGFVLRELTAANPLIDVRVFRHRAFSAATGAIGLTFFALFGSLFALTQYLQLVHGYSPLSAGVRALPFAAAVLVLSPVSPLLARWVGARWVVSAGLALMGTGLLVLTRSTPESAYSFLAAGVAVMGAGMGLVMAPAGEQIQSVLPPGQAGVGSAVNDTVQELGGSLGVAVIGSVVSASFRHSMDDSGLPEALRVAARPSIADAQGVAAHAGALGGQVVETAQGAFTTAMTHGFAVGGIVALGAAALMVFTLPRRAAVTPTEGETAEPAAVLIG